MKRSNVLNFWMDCENMVKLTWNCNNFTFSLDVVSIISHACKRNIL